MKTFCYLIILLLIFTACNSLRSAHYLNDEEIEMTVKVIEIRDSEKYSYFKVTDTKNSIKDTIHIVSFKNSIEKITNDKIHLKNIYTFRMKRIKPRVSTMEQLGAFIIVDNDTLQKASAISKISIFYKSLNTNGLEINQQ